MAFGYAVRVSSAIENQDATDDFVSLAYTKRVNSTGYLTVTFEANNRFFDSLQLNDYITVTRYSRLYSAVTDSTDFRGIYRGTTQQFTDNNDLKTIHCPDLSYALQQVIIAHKSGQTNLSAWSSKTVKKIIYDILINNTTPNAPASRLIPLSDVEVWLNSNVLAAPVGSTIDYAAAYKNVLEAIQDLIRIDGLDITLTGSTTGNGIFLDLQTLYGTDRRNSVHFWLERGNMLSPALDSRRENESTKVLVGGQGEGTARATETRTSANYSASNNHSEMFVDARHLSTNAALQALGDSALAQKAYRPNLTFEAVQTPSCFYGRHYSLGDIITAIYGGEAIVQKIVGVTVTVDAGQDKIALELENV